MEKKRTIKKLNLRKENIRHLNPEALKSVAGGDSWCDHYESTPVHCMDPIEVVAAE